MVPLRWVRQVCSSLNRLNIPENIRQISTYKKSGSAPDEYIFKK